jgi:hypothetical protein
MGLLYLAWKHAGSDPYRLFNRLDEDYRPIEGGRGGRRHRRRWPPPDPARLAHVIYGFAMLREQETLAATAASLGRPAG